MLNRCRVCENYINEDKCKLCEFEWAKEYPPCNDDEWDILNLNDDIEWSHLQIIDRLYYKNIECLFADIWSDNNIAFLIGVKGNKHSISKALGIHEECIYEDFEHGWVILNLFQEKYLRNLLK